jgi:hypothetical protein
LISFIGPAAIANAIKDTRALSELDVRGNCINAKDKSVLKKAAGVGIFRSRYVQLTFLSALKSAFNDT